MILHGYATEFFCFCFVVYLVVSRAPRGALVGGKRERGRERGGGGGGGGGGGACFPLESSRKPSTCTHSGCLTSQGGKASIGLSITLSPPNTHTHTLPYPHLLLSSGT